MGFRREPQITDLNQSARAGLDSITRDLTLAGYETPSAQAIWWNDGGGINPDEITIKKMENKRGTIILTLKKESNR